MSLLDGSAMYHLYFLPLILYLYLLFPLLNQLSWYSITGKIVFFFSLINVVVWGVIPEPVKLSIWINFSGFVGFENEKIQVASYTLLWLEYMTFGMTFFLTGIWSGKSGAWAVKIRKILPASNPVWYILIFGFFLYNILEFFYRINMGFQPDIAGRIWRFSIAVSAAIWICLISIHTSHKKSAFVSRLARASFLVYVIHPFILFYLDKYEIWGVMTRFIIVLTTSWLASIALQDLALKNRILGFLLGEGDRILAPLNTKR